MRLLRTTCVAVLLLTAHIYAQVPADVAGRWSSSVTSVDRSGKPLFDAAFVLEIKSAASGSCEAAIWNGPERMPFSSCSYSQGRLEASLEQYDGRITATRDSNRELKGEYVRQTRFGVMHFPFRASRETAERSALSPAQSLNGDWVFTFAESDNPDKVAPAVFTQNGANVHGTIAPVSGDYGLMSGTVVTANNGTEFRLSRFDGIHILLLEGRFTGPDAIAGTLSKSQAFTATRSKTAAENAPSPDSVTRMKDSNAPLRFSGFDPASGHTVTQADPRFAGKVLVVDIFGTWCPNCHDEAPVLQELYDKYHSQGLEIVSLAYEYTNDQARNTRQLDVFRKRFRLDFPMLISGTTDEGEIAKTLPQLENFFSYPTTLFVGRDGRVRKIHTGFSGPATGKLEELKQQFDAEVKELLSENGAR